MSDGTIPSKFKHIFPLAVSTLIWW